MKKKVIVIMVLLLVTTAVQARLIGTQARKPGRIEISGFMNIGSLTPEFDAMSGAELENYLWSSSTGAYHDLRFEDDGFDVDETYDIGIKLEYFSKKWLSFYGELAYHMGYVGLWEWGGYDDIQSFFSYTAIDLSLGVRLYAGDFYIGGAVDFFIPLSFDLELKATDPNSVAPDLDTTIDFKTRAILFGGTFSVGKVWRLGNTFSIDTGYELKFRAGDIVDDPGAIVSGFKSSLRGAFYVALTIGIN